MPGEIFFMRGNSMRVATSAIYTFRTSINFVAYVEILESSEKVQ